VVMSGFAYPILAESVWGHGDSVLGSNFRGSAAGHSYYDYAGGGVVHLAGGVAALVGNLMVGRRILRPPVKDFLPKTTESAESSNPGPEEKNRVGDKELLTETWHRRFDNPEDDEKEFRANSYLQIMGIFNLWVGCYGFNACTAFLRNDSSSFADASLAAWNTTLAASAGALGAFLHQHLFQERMDIGFICNGVLSGLVASTACCDALFTILATVIGFLAGFVVYPAGSYLLRRLRVDDPADAIAVHGGGGLFSVTVAAFSHPDCITHAAHALCHSGHHWGWQLLAQLRGAAVIIAWTTAVVMPVWALFLLSETIRSLELEELVALYERLCDSELGVVSKQEPALQSAAQRSWVVRRLLRHSSLDLHDLREDVLDAIHDTKTALEMESRVVRLFVGMLHVLIPSGEKLAAIPSPDLSTVRNLKHDLQKICGVPHFRQKILHEGKALEEDVHLDASMESVLLVLAAFCDASEEEIKELVLSPCQGSVDKVEKILRRSIDPNAATSDGKTALMLASQDGYPEIAQLLLEARADMDAADHDGTTALVAACRDGEEDMICWFLGARADVNKADGNDCTPLVTALQEGQLDIARLLVQAGAGTGPGPQGNDLLYTECQCSEASLETVRLLLEARVDANTETEDGMTALAVASEKGHQEIVEMLLASKADANQTDVYGLTALAMPAHDPPSARGSCAPAAAGCIAKVLRRCRLIRDACRLRLRIPPFAELVGLGALSKEGNTVADASRGVLSSSAERSNEEAATPLRLQLERLNRQVQNQGILLQRLSRGRRHSGWRRSNLYSVAEATEPTAQEEANAQEE
ncbi:unnamed protein product, partial [Symbiodinium necroappetens]